MKKLILLIGESGSGKDFLAWRANEDLAVRILPSLTTREIRSGESTRTHDFVTKEEFLSMDEQDLLIAKTYFNNNYYGTSVDQVMHNDIYIIDLAGYRYMSAKINLDFRDKCIKLIPIRVRTPMLLRLYRMVRRGDGLKKAIERISHDKEFFNFHKREMKSYWNLPLRNPGDFSKLVKKILK